MNFEEFLNILNKNKMAHLQKPYQPVTIKELLENDGSCPEEQLITKIREYDPKEEKQEHRRYKDVFSTEVIKKVTTYTEKTFSLKYIPKNKQEKNELIKVCDEWISNERTDKKIRDFVNDGMSEQVSEQLLRFWKRRGKVDSRDKLVKDGYHGMVKGVYRAKGEEFPQALMTRPESKYGVEIDRDHPTLKINYNFDDFENYSSAGNNQISWLEKAHDKKFPLGILFGYAENKWMTLGLCEITARLSKTHFVLEPYGITEQESTELKEEALRRLDRAYTYGEIKTTPDVDWSNIFSYEDMERFEGISEKAPNIKMSEVKISDIISRIDNGTLAIPKFQRYYQWKPDQVTALLNSIFHEYFVGNLFLWDIGDNEKERCGITPVEGSSITLDRLKGDEIVIDGQQRITSIYYAVKAPERNKDKQDNHPGYFYINFNNFFQNDGDEETIIRMKKKLDERETYRKLLFPFYNLEAAKRDAWIKELRKNVPKKTVLDTEKLEERLDIIRNKVNRFYTGYTMPEIEISNVDFDNIANIFERINTTGTKLDVFDLTIVKMWIYQVDVKTLWDKSKSDYKRINDYDQHLKVKLGRYIMEAMSLSFTTSKSCKRKEMLNMFHTEKWTTKSFNEMWEQTSLYIDKALEHLESTKTNGFGVITPKVLPYEPMLPILASLIREIEKNFKDDQPRCYEKLNQWYWTSVFAQRFSESVAAKKTSDSKDMIEWFQDESKIPKFITDFRKQFMGIDLRDETRGAVYSGMLCILAMKGAQDLEIRVSTKMISPHIDHIFPKSQINKKSKDSILNKTWLSEETNVGTKRALMPSKYITDVVKKKYDNDKKKFLEVLSSHMISDLGYDCLLNDDYDGFLESRENEMQKEIANRIGAEIEIDDLPTQTSKDTDFTNVRMLRNLVESCKDELSWVDKYFTIKDFDILQDGTASGNVKEIKILLAKQNADEKMKSDFKRFKNEMEKTRGIECQMRVMNKEISDEIHDRYLICPNQSYNIVSGDTARRGQVGDISECARPDIERWWEASYDIFEDWNKFQD